MNTATQKIALVTGATRGIGLETVRQLAQAGVHTLLAGRKRDIAVAEALKLQAFMTGTERPLFAALEGRAQFVAVEGGGLSV